MAVPSFERTFLIGLAPCSLLASSRLARSYFYERVPLLNKIARTFNPNFSYLALFSTPAVRVPTARVDGPTTITAAGPYCFSRNPIYRAFTLLYAGVTVLANARWVAVLLPGVLIVMQRGMIEREERYRERGFGDEYRRYKAHVRRWV